VNLEVRIAPAFCSDRYDVPAVFARTDAQGRYAVEVPFVGDLIGYANGPGLSPGDITRDVEGSAHVRVVPGERAMLDLTVGPSATAKGRVIDARGNPVADACVRAKLWTGYVGNGLEHLTGTRTDATGQFAFNELLPGARYEFTADAAGFLPTKSELVPALQTSDPPVELVLRRPVWLTVRVETDAGRPLPDATAWAGPVSYHRISARTDSSGGALLGPFYPEPLEVGASAAGRARVEQNVDLRNAAPTDTAGTTVVLRLPEGLAIAGRLTNAGGEPLPGFTVRLVDGPGPDWATATDAEGRYRLEAVPPGTWSLTFEEHWRWGTDMRTRARAGDEHVDAVATDARPRIDWSSMLTSGANRTL
jgi:hypothetical protein